MRPIALALALSLTAHVAHADPVRWPAAPRETVLAAIPPALRWHGDAWVSASPARLQRERDRIAAALRAQPESPELLAARAVLARVLGRFDDARTDLARATALSPAVLDDPDVRLTDAYLLAQSGHFAEAAARIRPVFAMLDATGTPGTENRLAQSELLVEVARWHLARGTDGLDDALALARTAIALSPQVPIVRATFALVLLRRGALDDARAVARATTSAEGYVVPLRIEPPGGLTVGDTLAAAGTALALDDAWALARPLLVCAARSAPAVWRADLARRATEAERHAPGPPPANCP